MFTGSNTILITFKIFIIDLFLNASYDGFKTQTHNASVILTLLICLCIFNPNTQMDCIVCKKIKFAFTGARKLLGPCLFAYIQLFSSKCQILNCILHRCVTEEVAFSKHWGPTLRITNSGDLVNYHESNMLYFYCP